MIHVNNKKAIHNLANKSYQANKTRNVIAITAIALTALLFTSLFTMGIGTIESLQQASIRQAGGDGHAVLKYITDEQYEAVKDNRMIDRIAYNRMLCDDVENEQLLKRHAEFWYHDEVGLQLGFCQPTTGQIPKAQNEVIVDTKTLELLGIPLELGAPIKLTLNIRGKTVIREFILCGWWESDPGFNVGQIIASRSYVDAHTQELQNTYYEDYSLTGAINAYILFKDSTNLQQKLDRLLQQSGFSSIQTQPNYIESNVNWAYLSTNFTLDAGTIIGLGCGLALIILTGYLIIYNIFQISIVRDIRFYGLLKTIGTTGKQIRHMIRQQALILSSIGIPIGLILGFLCGKQLVPLLMRNTSYAGSAVSVSINPWIFIGSALFALGTVLISTLKPAWVAAKVCAIEAVRYTQSDLPKRLKQKKSRKGAKIPRIALSNLTRNKKRTVLTVISLSLSLILMNTAFTLSNSISMDKFLSKFNDTDFLVAHADYFNNDFYGVDNQTSQQLIATIEHLPSFVEGGRLYGGRDELFTTTDPNATQQYNRNDKGDLYTVVYGLDPLPMGRLKLLDGEMDMAKLNKGDCILEGVHLDDHGNPEWGTAHFKVGETVTLHNYRGSSENFADRQYTTHPFTVIGHIAIMTYSNSDRTYWDYTYYLPSEIYKSLVTQPAVMSYAFNVAKGQEATVESFLKSYTNTVEPTMNYTSKAVTRSSFDGMRQTVLVIGGALSAIMAIIGILNFINAVLTSILSRKKEFAMLQSIGMTRKQLRQMLCFEGLYYASFTAIASIVFGILSSIVIVQELCTKLWFMDYQLMVWPIALTLPLLLILGIVVPLISYHATDTQSVVERLREAE